MQLAAKFYLSCLLTACSILAASSDLFISRTFAAETGGTSGVSAPNPNPIRISREFFRGPLVGVMSTGTISQGSNSTSLSVKSVSPILWIEYAPTAPDPLPGALADFRDHLGCAYLSGVEAKGIAVCFNMMGDVSSLGVNSREMSLLGVQEYLASSVQIESTTGANCQPSIQGTRFDGASGSEGAIDLTFVADVSASPECDLRGEVLNIQFRQS